MKKKQGIKLSTLIVAIVGVSIVSILGTLLVERYRNESVIEKPIPQETQEVPQTSQSKPGPQSFSGILPCADCSGLKTDLTLQKNSDDPSEGIYILKQTYEGKDMQPITTLGKWDLVRGSSENPGAIIIKLKPANGDASQYWLVVDNDTLRMLDSQMNQITSSMNEDLKRISQ